MELVPKPSLLQFRKPGNKSAALAETNGTLTPSMPESGIQWDERVTSSKNPEVMATLNRGTASMHSVPKILLDSLPLKYSGTVSNSREGTKYILAHSLFDKFKRQNKDPTGEHRTEQWVPMRGTPHGGNFSDLCRAGKLSVNVNRNNAVYAACIPKQSGRSRRSTDTWLIVVYAGKQANMSVQDIRFMPGILCIGVEDATYCGTGTCLILFLKYAQFFNADYVGDGGTNDPLLPQNAVELEM